MSPELLQVGTRFRTVQSELSPIPFDSGNVRSVEIPRSFPYREFFLRLSGSVTVAVANLANPADDYPLQLLPRIDIIADGRRQIASMSGQQLYRLAHLMNGYQPELSAPTLNIGAVPFAVSIPINLDALRMISPVESMFDPRPYEKVELRVTWGTSNALAQNGAPGGGTTLAVAASTQVAIQTLQTVEGVSEILFNRLHSTDEVVVTASQSNLAVNVPRSGLLAGILLQAKRNDLKVDDIVNFVTLKSDNTNNHIDRIGWSTLQRRNAKDYQLIIPGGTAASVLNGWAWLELTEDGMLSSALNTLDLSMLQLIFDVTFGAGTQKIGIGYLFYEPLVAI